MTRLPELEDGGGTGEIYRRVLDQVNEQVSVDWDALDVDYPDQRDAWRRLRRVQEVSGAFKQVQAELPIDPARHGDEQQEFKMWGSLEVREKLGEGSFSEVFRAHDPVLRRDVALKLAKGETEAQRQRFLNEGRLLAQLDHQSVVRVHGAAIHGGQAGVWMDLAQGRSLDRRLEEDGRLSEGEVIEILAQLAEGLAAVHARGLVHGDIKAANVLRRDGGALVLGDFGSSIDLSSGVAELGSASPMSAAPEVLQGKAADARSDIYSLGVLAYNLLTKEYPFEGTDAEELMTAHREASSTALLDRRGEISPALAALIDRAHALAPEDRWQSARSLGEALERLGGPETRRGRHSRGASIAGGLLVVALLAWWLSLRPDQELAPAVVAMDTTGRSFETGVGRDSSSVRASLFRAGDAAALRNGDVVRLGDALHLRVQTDSEQTWLYLINEDADGEVFTLFPIEGAEPANPLAAGEHRLPGRVAGVDQDWVVTSQGRTESFLLIRSDQPLPEFERAIEKILVASASRTPEAAPMFNPTTRGVGGLEESVSAASPEALVELRELVLSMANGRLIAADIVTLRGTGSGP